MLPHQVKSQPNLNINHVSQKTCYRLTNSKDQSCCKSISSRSSETSLPYIHKVHSIKLHYGFSVPRKIKKKQPDKLFPKVSTIKTSHTFSPHLCELGRTCAGLPETNQCEWRTNDKRHLKKVKHTKLIRLPVNIN